MIISESVLTDLLQFLPDWRPQMYFKASLTALSHAMEDQVLAGLEDALIIASFQQERFYRQEANRYRRIAQNAEQVYVLAAPETDFKNHSGEYETIAFQAQDALSQEWHLVVIGQNYASCLICRERMAIAGDIPEATDMDNNRRFEGIWTFDRQISQKAASILLNRIVAYRPELKAKVQRASDRFLSDLPEILTSSQPSPDISPNNNPDPFVQRLVTYLQAGQYKLIKANRSLAAKEQKERLINSVMTAIRQSLDPEAILQVAVEKLGEGLGVCRCLLYRCEANDISATIEHEFLNEGIGSLKGQAWPLKNNPLFQEVLTMRDALKIDNAHSDPRIIETKPSQSSKLSNLETSSLQSLIKSCSIVSLLLVPILYQGKLLGMVELHHCGAVPLSWKSEDIALVDAVATQIGVALIQAEAYASLQDLNEQLEALDRTRSNLVAITGHELRTPLSTIQVCLESLASEPDMSLDLRQVMLNTALNDAERMRKLVQDFLTLSQLESGRVVWHPEPISVEECVELALSNVRSLNRSLSLPTMENQIAPDSPLVKADGEWLVEVLAKLLDNACKFTPADGRITIAANSQDPERLVVAVTDTGRGIEPQRLETVFDRFYQEEGALRRSAGGTGLGLAICRQIVLGWGGEIWAESTGKNQGSRFNFTIPILKEAPNLGPQQNPALASTGTKSAKNKRAKPKK
jgi:DICT domain-containing protein/signal transduction histidine kinase